MSPCPWSSVLVLLNCWQHWLLGLPTHQTWNNEKKNRKERGEKKKRQEKKKKEKNKKKNNNNNKNKNNNKKKRTGRKRRKKIKKKKNKKKNENKKNKIQHVIRYTSDMMPSSRWTTTRRLLMTHSCNLHCRFRCRTSRTSCCYSLIPCTAPPSVHLQRLRHSQLRSVCITALIGTVTFNGQKGDKSIQPRTSLLVRCSKSGIPTIISAQHSGLLYWTMVLPWEVKN